MTHQCTFCLTRLFENLLTQHPIAEEDKPKIIKHFFEYMAQADFSRPSPEVARDVHAMIRDILQNDDPYQEQKQQANEQLLKQYERLKAQIQQAQDPKTTALRMAIAGNIIDYGPAQQFDITQTLEEVFKKPPAIDHSKELLKAISKAETILYLGDNAGEIVFDKLFIETIGHPNIYFAVRDRPIINDATMFDARQTGIDQVAKVITNGDDAPSTLLYRVSDPFLKVWQQADLIISKGMGNLEGLISEADPRIYFLFMVKCQAIGDLIGARKGDVIVSQHPKNKTLSNKENNNKSKMADHPIH